AARESALRLADRSRAELMKLGGPVPLPPRPPSLRGVRPPSFQSHNWGDPFRFPPDPPHCAGYDHRHFNLTTGGTRSASPQTPLFARGKTTVISIFQRPELWGLAAQAELLPACSDILVYGSADLRPLRELLDVTVLHAGVDQRLGPVGPLLRRV